jgi:hypothetical protein
MADGKHRRSSEIIGVPFRTDRNIRLRSQEYATFSPVNGKFQKTARVSQQLLGSPAAAPLLEPEDANI